MLHTLRECPEFAIGTCRRRHRRPRRARPALRGAVGRDAGPAPTWPTKRTVVLAPQDGQDDATREVFADRGYEPVGADLTDIELAGYGYRWIRLARTIGARAGSAR